MLFRKATKEDVQDIVAMLAADKLGAKREDYSEPLPEVYYQAFERIHEDHNQELIVLENEGEVIGTLHLSFIQYLTYKGGIRAQVEAVRVKENQRSKGVGKQLFEWAIDRAKEKGAHLIQLTTDKTRDDAVEFYKSLGFQPSHIGMKLHFK